MPGEITAWAAAIENGAYSLLSSYASGRETYDEAIDRLLERYSGQGMFTERTAELVIQSFDAGRVGITATDALNEDEPIIPPAAAYNPSIGAGYQYDTLIEFECYGQTGNVFVRIDSDEPMSPSELYGKALDEGFARLTSPKYGGAAAEEECEPTGTLQILAAYQAFEG